MEALYHIDFEPMGLKVNSNVNQSLLEIAISAGIEIANLCGGKGTCRNCKVQILDGKVSEPIANEQALFRDQELKNGWRLACQTYPKSDCKVRVPAESLTVSQRLQIESLQVNVAPEPSVIAHDLKLSPPTLGKHGFRQSGRCKSDVSDDAQRLIKGLKQIRISASRHKFSNHDGKADTQHATRITHAKIMPNSTSRHLKENGQLTTHPSIDIEVLRQLSPLLRSLNWQIRAFVHEDEVIAIGNRSDKYLGLAVDLGTTKIAGYLLDLGSGKTLAAKGMMNPQISHGEDIISRMTFVKSSPSNAKKIQELTINLLNQFAADLCTEIEATPKQIVDVAIAGNTVMHHLFLGLPVEQLGVSPYVPAVCQSLNIKVRDVGLDIADGAYLHMLPNIAGFVGGDHIAMLLATDVWQSNDLTIAIDIGTNTEVSLICDGEITSVSCASGPAFEGAHIKDGMRAANGAIERLRLVNNSIEYQTIGGQPPVGLCGSGILDAVSQLYLVGVLDFRGKMGNHPRVRVKDGIREFVLINEAEQNGKKAITITQNDIREIQLAKGAIRAGIQILLDKTGYSKDDIQKIIIAGAFGSYIDIESAVTIGMLPDIPLDRFEQVGNAVGMGVKMVLISRKMRTEAENLRKKVNYIDLTTEPGFNKTFAKASYLGNKLTG